MPTPARDGSPRARAAALPAPSAESTLPRKCSKSKRVRAEGCGKKQEARSKEQRATSNEQRATSNEQRAKNKEQGTRNKEQGTRNRACVAVQGLSPCVDTAADVEGKVLKIESAGTPAHLWLMHGGDLPARPGVGETVGRRLHVSITVEVFPHAKPRAADSSGRDRREHGSRRSARRKGNAMRTR